MTTPSANPDTQSLKNYNKLISDFSVDLSRTFPDYRHLWAQWEQADIPEPVLRDLLAYMAKVFPERFFDILYQNEDVMKSGDADVRFLPGVDFRVLFALEITENTKQTVWKYLQLILFQIMEEVKNKAAFGEAASMFEGIKEEELQNKLQETFDNLQTFFAKQSTAGADASSSGADASSSGAGESPFQNMNMGKIQEHLKKLMDGRIGSLVKELMEDLKDDLAGFQQSFAGNVDEASPPDMNEIMKQMMKDPSKIMKVMKKVSEKLKTHMTTDNQSEYMHETMDILKEMGGREGFMQMFEQMKQGMGGAGKNMKMDVNALARLEKQSASRERMLRNLQTKKATGAADLLKKREDGSQVFRIDGQTQPQSSMEDIEKIMKDLGLNEEPAVKKGKKLKNGK